MSKHRLAVLADEANARAIARHESFLATLKARKGLVAILTATPLTFEREPGDFAAYHAFEVARSCAGQLIERLHPDGIDHVSIAWGEGPRKMHVKASNKRGWTGFALVSERELLDAWTAAEERVSARPAHAEVYALHVARSAPPGELDYSNSAQEARGER